MKVLVDPGHGGVDHGAVANGLKESLITLSIAKKLKTLLSSEGRITVDLTRETDQFLGLAERVKMGREKKSQLIVSVHVNWSSDTRAKGVEVYFQNQLPSDENSMYLAARENKDSTDSRIDPHWLQSTSSVNSTEVDLILQDLHKNFRVFQSSQLAKAIAETWEGGAKSKSASVQQAPFFVISNNSVPSVLVEVGFLTHSKEGPLLGTEDYQWTIAKSLHAGITKYYETLDKAPRSRLE